MTNCYICEKGELKQRKVPYSLYGIKMGGFDAEVCEACHEIFFSEAASRNITKATKQKGLWGIQNPIQ